MSYSFVRYLSCFNPVNRASKIDICSAKFRKVLSLLVNVFRVAKKDCDTLLQEFDLFLDNIPVFASTQFANFDSSHDRLDSLLYKFMIGDAFKNLLEVVKLVLVLSHGQAAVERGFSVNREAEVENLKGHTLIAMRTVIDHVNSVDGIFNVEISKQLLLSFQQSRQCYGLCLEEEREENKS